MPSADSRKKRRKEQPEARASGVPAAVGEHIATIAELEQRWLHERKLGEHLGDSLAARLGSLPMVIGHAVWFAAWFAVNLEWIPGVKPFDPYPFGLLTMLVSLEAIFLSLFLLISQNRLTHQADKRTHLDIQVNLLVETEVTAILRVLRRLCMKMEVDYEAEVRELATRTDLREMVEAVEKSIPESSGSEARPKPPRS